MSGAVKGRAVVGAVDPHMNRGEAAYAVHLEALRRADLIDSWAFEPGSLRLADRTHYHPDFRVVLPDGLIEFHEVKGRKGDGPYIKEDAWVKLKAIAAIHPFVFIVVWPLKGGGWGRREV